MAATIQAAGVELSYTEQGDGPAVLLVHGIADDSSGWDDVVASLRDGARVIAYDRRGYGGSGQPEPYEATTVGEQAEDAAALVRALDAAPVVACGRDLGALVVLDLLHRHGALVRAAVLLDPLLHAFAPKAFDALVAERIALEASLRESGPEEAVAAWVGDGDPARAERAKRAHRAFFADFGGLATWPVTRAELRALTQPLRVFTGPRASVHTREGADALAGLAPAAERVEGADPVAALRDLLAA